MRPHGPSHYDFTALLQRLFRNRVIDPVTECWLWPRCNTSGYGQMFFDHRGEKYAVSVHRLVAWIYLNYDGTRRLDVCHRCNVKACFNPAHLYLASHQQNILDGVRDGAFDVELGERNGPVPLVLIAGGDDHGDLPVDDEPGVGVGAESEPESGVGVVNSTVWEVYS